MSGSYLTPPQVAEQLGVDADKIRRWIEKGELTAVNLAENLGGRPRYRISSEALEQFLACRQATPAPKPVHRRRCSFERKYYT